MTALKIDFVSDISCPWCAIGLAALEQALAQAQDAVQAELHIQPFELNPQMAPGGEDLVAHLSAKYGSSPAQIAQIHETIRQRGAEVGFTFAPGRSRLYNTFDAHRLIYWAGLHSPAQQHALKKALQVAYFTQGQSPEDPAALCQAAAQVGLDAQEAARVLTSGDYADEVRAQEAFYQGAGIRSVPAVVINDQHLISGGQPVAVFEQALRQIAAEA